MDKCICDICRKNDAVHHFKVKKKMRVVRGGFHVERWVRMDVCDVCYHKLREASDKSTHDIGDGGAKTNGKQTSFRYV